MNIVPLTRMSADHVGPYSTDRNFSGNSVDPDKILHYAPSDPCADRGSPICQKSSFKTLD